MPNPPFPTPKHKYSRQIPNWKLRMENKCQAYCCQTVSQIWRPFQKLLLYIQNEIYHIERQNKKIPHWWLHTSKNEQKTEEICHIMTGNGISMCTIRESLVALHIQRQHKIYKEDRCTELAFLCSLVIVKTRTCFTYGHWLAQGLGFSPLGS